MAGLIRRCARAAALVALAACLLAVTGARAPFGQAGTARAKSLPGSSVAARARVPGAGVPGWAGRIGGLPRPAGPYGAQLDAVHALSATNAWAVGYSCTTACSNLVTLIRHWNGRSWVTVPGPSGAKFSALNAVSAVSAGDAWAVGSYCQSGCGSSAEVDRTLALRWNGRSWSKVATPDPARLSFLNDVSVVSATNAWAVGYSCKKGSGCPNSYSPVPSTVLLHWNGRSWIQVTVRSTGFAGSFNAVDAVSAGDVWVAGYRCVSGCGTRSEVDRTLILHWNGRSWSRIASPSPGSLASLYALTFISASDAWAVGAGGNGTLILRWSGRSWSEVASPGSGQASLFGVTAVSPTAAWATGTICTKRCGTASSIFRSLIVRWNGRSWAKVASPDPNPGWDFLFGASATSAANAWAVGSSCGIGCTRRQPLIAHWNGSGWR
jgi:hypothetical protein